MTCDSPGALGAWPSHDCRWLTRWRSSYNRLLTEWHSWANERWWSLLTGSKMQSAASATKTGGAPTTIIVVDVFCMLAIVFGTRLVLCVRLCFYLIRLVLALQGFLSPQFVNLVALFISFLCGAVLFESDATLDLTLMQWSCRWLIVPARNDGIDYGCLILLWGALGHVRDNNPHTVFYSELLELTGSIDLSYHKDSFQWTFSILHFALLFFTIIV